MIVSIQFVKEHDTYSPTVIYRIVFVWIFYMELSLTQISSKKIHEKSKKFTYKSFLTH